MIEPTLVRGSWGARSEANSRRNRPNVDGTNEAKSRNSDWNKCTDSQTVEASNARKELMSRILIDDREKRFVLQNMISIARP